MPLMTKKIEFGRTGIKAPPIIFGTSALGNLYQAVPYEDKLKIVSEICKHVSAPVVLDSAGKYGAGFSLEIIGRTLKELGIRSEDVIISNKLGWYRVPLKGAEPTFETGVWMDIDHDAEQYISYDGILKCYEQGCELLDGFSPQLVSVHDPDEYLVVDNNDERKKRFDDILGAYQALFELKSKGLVKGVGVGAKDWRVIRELSEQVDLDWVMFACSLTIMKHPPELLDFISQLHQKGVAMINSAVFHAGFLTGGQFFDYRKVDPDDPAFKSIIDWKNTFDSVCQEFGVKPAEACVQFGLTVPGIIAVALNTGKPSRIAQNVESVSADIPTEFWKKMQEKELIAVDYPYF